MKRGVENLNPSDRPWDEDEIAGNFRKVFLYGRSGRYAKVDPDKYELVIKYHWYLYRDKRTCYAVSSTYTEDGKCIRLAMHRVVSAPEQGMVVHHVNHDGLDNRMENLRVCTVSQNHQSRVSKRNVTSKYVGVYFHNAANMWTAEIGYYGKRQNLGFFLCEIDAALVYDFYARKYKGEFAQINFPDITLSTEEVDAKRYKSNRTKKQYAI